MDKLRQFFNSKTGKQLSIGLVLVGMLAFIWSIRANFGRSEAAVEAGTRIFMDAQTGQSFRHDLKMGESIPVDAPSGGKSGYPAELCFWTADGGTKTDPTPVLMNEYVGKSGPTFCPDCGRLVVPHNPGPEPGRNPPPTEAEFKGRGAARAAPAPSNVQDGR